MRDGNSMAGMRLMKIIEVFASRSWRYTLKLFFFSLLSILEHFILWQRYLRSPWKITSKTLRTHHSSQKRVSQINKDNSQRSEDYKVEALTTKSGASSNVASTLVQKSFAMRTGITFIIESMAKFISRLVNVISEKEANRPGMVLFHLMDLQRWYILQSVPFSGECKYAK